MRGWWLPSSRLIPVGQYLFPPSKKEPGLKAAPFFNAAAHSSFCEHSVISLLRAGARVTMHLRSPSLVVSLVCTMFILGKEQLLFRLLTRASHCTHRLTKVALPSLFISSLVTVVERCSPQSFPCSGAHHVATLQVLTTVRFPAQKRAPRRPYRQRHAERLLQGMLRLSTDMLLWHSRGNSQDSKPDVSIIVVSEEREAFKLHRDLLISKL